jgi:hypothetical protein
LRNRRVVPTSRGHLSEVLMTQQTTPTDAELAEVLKKHIWYELARLVAQYELLREPKRYRAGVHEADVEHVDDALIVSFCTHARNVLEFLWRTDPKGWGYALAINYANNKYRPPELRGRLEALYRQLCRQINHLTMGRTDESSEKMQAKERDELVGIIHDEIERLVKHLRSGYDARYFALDHLADAKRKSMMIAVGAVGATNEVQFLMSESQATHTTTPTMSEGPVPILPVRGPPR